MLSLDTNSVLIILYATISAAAAAGGLAVFALFDLLRAQARPSRALASTTAVATARNPSSTAGNADTRAA